MSEMNKNLENFENQYWQKHIQGVCFRHQAAFKLINKGPILDLGCGDGLFLEMLKKRGIGGVGIEISGVALKKARAKGLDVRKINFSEDKLPFKDHSFETVVLLDVLEHLYQPEEVLKEVYRVSRGGVVISVPNFNSLPARIQMVFGKTPGTNKPKRGHLYWISYSVIKDLLKKGGFKIEKIEVNTFFSWLPGVKTLMQFLAEIKPSIFALNFVIRAKKI